MGNDQGFLDTTPLSESSVELLRRAPVPDPRVSLIVFHGGGATLVSLEPGASVVVGREPPSDVVIADRSLSRQHARFSWIDAEVIVEDLGSTNGTFVRGEKAARGVVRSGDVCTLGAVAVSLHEVTAQGSGLSGMVGHDRFRLAVEEEARRARHFGRTFGLLMVRAAPELPVASWWSSVQRLLGPVDKIALYSADCLEVLLPEATSARAVELATKIAEAGLDGVGKPSCGVATYPDAATTSEKLIEVCRAALRAADAEQPVRTASADGSRAWTPDPASSPRGEGPVVESPAMQAVFRMVDRLARSVIPVLLHGETGTGKEVLARAIHLGGPRRDRPLVSVNCGAIPQQLVESTLFGHERGAFTGALQQHKGVFEAADGGAVLLDEIAELPAPAQAALLRVLETKRVTRVGSTKEIEVDVRVIAATHRDLEAMCTEGEFRRDLLYRLNVMTVTIPPLRARIEEIAPLCARFLEEANTSNGRSVGSIDAAALALLERYAWPGNVRELRNVVERAVVIAEGDTITTQDLPETVRAPSAMVVGRSPSPPARTNRTEPPAAPDMKSQMQRHEAVVIFDALKKAAWNQSEAARELRIPLRTLVHKIKQYGIKKLGYELG